MFWRSQYVVLYIELCVHMMLWCVVLYEAWSCALFCLFISVSLVSQWHVVCRSLYFWVYPCSFPMNILMRPLYSYWYLYAFLVYKWNLIKKKERKKTLQSKEERKRKTKNPTVGRGLGEMASPLYYCCFLLLLLLDIIVIENMCFSRLQGSTTFDSWGPPN